jgi:uncharacterized delta-60 repeat protein
MSARTTGLRCAGLPLIERLEARRLLSGAPGSLDTSFGKNGVTYFSESKPLGISTIATAALPDGKIILLGSVQGGSGDEDYNIALGRLNADGSPDKSFGKDGLDLIAGYVGAGAAPKGVLPQVVGAEALAIDSQGRIYVGGNGLARFNPDGSIDTSFGHDGVANVGADAIAIDGNGDIFLGSGVGEGESSYQTQTAMSVQEVNPSGAVMTSFGDQGTAIAEFTRRGQIISSAIGALSVDQYGDVTVVGGDNSDLDSFGYLEIARFDRNGTLDRHFGSRGETVIPHMVTGATFDTLDISQDGEIFAGGGGNGNSYTGAPLVLAAFSRNGKLDPAFGSGGILSDSFNSSYSDFEARTIKLLSNGKLLVVGDYADFNPYSGLIGSEILLARLSSNGVADSSFGQSLPGTVDGHAAPAGWHGLQTEDGVANAVTLSDGGFLLGINGTREQTTSQFTALRFKADGSLDRAFGRSGAALLTTSIPGPAVTDQIFTSPGEPTYLSVNGNIFRLDDFGVIDPSLEITESPTNVKNIPVYDQRILAIQPDGKILAQSSTDLYGALQRYNPDGTVDRYFGDNGEVRFRGTGTTNSIAQLLLRSDGSMVVYVSMAPPPYPSFPTAALYLVSSSGQIVASGASPQDPMDFGNSPQYGSIALAPDGDVLVLNTIPAYLSSPESQFILGLSGTRAHQLRD